jgi:hypothetical protein
MKVAGVISLWGFTPLFLASTCSFVALRMIRRPHLRLVACQSILYADAAEQDEEKIEKNLQDSQQ